MSKNTSRKKSNITLVPVRKTESISEELNEIHNRITRRAYEIFDGNGQSGGDAVDHWLAAERELILKPPIEVEEKDDELQVHMAVEGVDPEDVVVQVTPEDILIKAELHHHRQKENGNGHDGELINRSLFRAVHLPRRIVPDKVIADFKQGTLNLKAPIAQM